MLGTVLNAAGILVGGAIGLTVTKQLSPAAQTGLKGLIGVLTIFVGLQMTYTSLRGSFWEIVKQLTIVVLALTLGRLTGRLLHLQKSLNRLGTYAKEKFARADPNGPHRFSDGFITCALLFCVGPMAMVGAIQDGLGGKWQTLGIKSLMDGLATMAFVSAFGWSVILSVIPVVAYQGTITLLAQSVAPYLRNHVLMESVNATGGLLVFCIALIILEIKKFELADYLPSLAFAPLITWLWR